MHVTFRRPSAQYRLVCLIGLIAVLLDASAAQAQHRARMSSGLNTQLTSGGSAPTQVLVEAPQSEVDRLAATYGVHVQKRLGMGAVLTGTSAQLNQVAGDSNVGALNANDVVTVTDAVTDEATGASQLWSTHGGGGSFDGITGSGVGVAVIDSGISNHPDIAKRIAYSVDFTNDESGVADGYGHGTHVAGIIAGSGKGSQTSDGAAYAGMAPGANLISLRVLGADGTGYVSDVIDAIEWTIKNKDRFHIRVINLSLGHAPTSAPADDPLAQAAEQAVKAGLVVVASAGNFGKTDDGTPVIGGIVSPGDTPGALTVGALNTHGTVMRSDDTVATYSSRGPVGDPDDPSTWIIKPDLVAPGNAIVSTGAVGSYLWTNYPEFRVTGASGGDYMTLSGSSMATAVVSGAVAQLLQASPSLSPNEVKFALQFTAQHLDGFGIIEQGAGSLNVPLAVALAETKGLQTIPVSDKIGGGSVEAGLIVFGETIVWGGRGVDANTIVWGGRGVDANTIVWGGRGVDANTIVWGGRGVDANTIVWGGRGVGCQHRSCGADAAWMPTRSCAGGNVALMPTRSCGVERGVDANTIVWGGRGVDANTIVWGGATWTRTRLFGVGAVSRATPSSGVTRLFWKAEGYRR